MKSPTMCLLFAMGQVAAAGAGAAAEPVAAKPLRSRVALAAPLPPLDGKRLQVSIVELTYEPGGTSAAHTHPCPVMVYVLEGAIRTQVGGEPEAIYRAGQTFQEAPGSIHAISANASARAPARFLAIFICDRDTPLTLPVPAGPRRGRP